MGQEVWASHQVGFTYHAWFSEWVGVNLWSRRTITDMLDIRYNHSGRLGKINWLYGVMGIANAQRGLEYIRVLTEFIT